MALLAAGGCSTVILSENSHSPQSAAEHAALVEAASAVSQAGWPKPQEASWSDRLTGGEANSARVSEDDAAEVYVATLGAPRKSALLDDAARHLEAARALAAAADAAASTLRPAMADVSVVETAIADLRQARDIYLKSLDLVARDGEAIASAERRRLKADFGYAIKELGAAADALEVAALSPGRAILRWNGERLAFVDKLEPA